MSLETTSTSSAHKASWFQLCGTAMDSVILFYFYHVGYHTNYDAAPAPEASLALFPIQNQYLTYNSPLIFSEGFFTVAVPGTATVKL